VEPKYEVVHRGTLDIQSAWEGTADNRVRQLEHVPKALVVRVALPRLESIAGMDLDVSTQVRPPLGLALLACSARALNRDRCTYPLASIHAKRILSLTQSGPRVCPHSACYCACRTCIGWTCGYRSRLTTPKAR
jgi:hypothetical protein